MHPSNPTLGRISQRILLGFIAATFALGLMIVAWRSFIKFTSQAETLAKHIDAAHIRLFLQTPHEDMWKKMDEMISQSLPLAPFPRNLSLVHGKTYQLAVVNETGSTLGWIMFIIPREQDRQPMTIFSDTTAKSLFASDKRKIMHPLSDAAIFREITDGSGANTVLIDSSLFQNRNAHAKQINAEDLLLSILGTVHWLSLSWNRDQGTLRIVRPETTTPDNMHPFDQPPAPVLHDVWISLQDIAPLPHIKQISEQWKAAYPNFFGGLQGITRYQWNEWFGSGAQITKEVETLLSHSISMEIGSGSGGQIALLLSGSLAPPDTYKELLKNFMDASPAIRIRHQQFSPTQGRTDVLLDSPRVNENNIGSWHLQWFTRPSDNRTLAIANLANRYLLSNDLTILAAAISHLQSAVPFADRSATAKGAIDLLWAKQVITAHFASLLDGPFLLPWYTLNHYRTVRWTVSEKREESIVRWHFE